MPQRIRLCTSSVLYGAGLDTAIDEAGRLNLDGFDLWVTPGMGEHLPPDASPERLADVRRRLQDNELALEALSAYATHAVDGSIDLLVRFLDIAAALDCPVVVTGEGNRPGDRALGLDEYANYLEPALDKAHVLGITLALENHRDHRWMGRAEDTLALFDHCRHPALGLALAHHPYVAEGDDPMAVAGALADRLALVYAWDWATQAQPPKHWKDPGHQMLGTGDLPWDEYLQQLLDLEWSGPLVIFAHGSEESWDTAHTSAAVERVREWLAERI